MDDHPTKASHILEVIWHPFPLGLLKVNTNCAAFGGSVLTNCVGVLRTCRGFIKGYFNIPLDICFAFEPELVVVVHAIKYTWTFNWRGLSLESDSAYLVALLRSHSRRVHWR